MSSCINNRNTSGKTHQVLLQSVCDMESCHDWSVNHNRVEPVSDGNVLRWKYQRWLLSQSCFIAQLSFTWGCYTLLMPTVYRGSLSKILVVHCLITVFSLLQDISNNSFFITIFLWGSCCSNSSLTHNDNHNTNTQKHSVKSSFQWI